MSRPASSSTPPARLAVLDLETTGVGPHDRAVELAVVLLDGETLEVVDELDTLLNPERDVGPTDIHGITATMVSAAPTFAELAGTLAPWLDGAVLVAHNLAFDARILALEFARLGAPLDPGAGLCTYRLTGERLARATARHHIPLEGHHRALADARAAAALLRVVTDGAPAGGEPARVFAPSTGRLTHTLRREAVGAASSTPLARLLAASCVPSSAEPAVVYFDLLDRVLADGEVSPEERASLDEAIARLALGPGEVRAMHEAYLASIVEAALRDHVITPEERRLLETAARALGLGDVPLPAVTPVARGPVVPGLRVCFSGAATDARGRPVPRAELERLAARHGLQPVATVSKKGCDLLVVQDPSTASTKAQAARRHGVPVITVAGFLAALEP